MFILKSKHKRIVEEFESKLKNLELVCAIKDDYIQELQLDMKRLKENQELSKSSRIEKDRAYGIQVLEEEISNLGRSISDGHLLESDLQEFTTRKQLLESFLAKFK